MIAPLPAAKTYRFGLFELSLGSRLLLKNGRELHLQEQPMRLLMLLLERPGEVHTREELRERLWPTETFVEFDDGLNTAVQKIRQALGDDARNPRFVETVPRRGYRFIAPVQVDAGHVVTKLTVVTENPAVGRAAVVEAATTQVRPVWQWVAVAAGLVGMAGGWFLPHGVKPAQSHAVKLSITPPAGVELRAGIRGGSAISPDGRTVAFVAGRNGKSMLWVRSLDSLEARELAGTEDALLPFWSPDSKSLGFLAAGKLKRVEVAGGAPWELATASRPTRGAWTEDGTILYSAGAGAPIYRVKATGGAAAVTTVEAGGAGWPYPLLGTDKFLYFHNARREVQMGSLSDAQLRSRMVASNSNAVYAPPYGGRPGYLLYLQGTLLVARALDASSGRMSEEIEPVAEGVGFAERSRFMDLSVSNTGVLVYGAGNTNMGRLAWVRRDGSLIGYLSEPDWFNAARLSPDGRRAIIERGLAGSRALWMMNFERNILTRITFEQELSGWPTWSPDGRQIAYSGERGGQMGLFRRDSSGATPEERLVTTSFNDFMYDWSSDGRYLVYCEVNPQSKLDLWVLPVGGKPYPLLASPFNEDTPEFSRDVRWMAYVSDETGRNEVYVTSFPGRGGKWQVSTSGGTRPHWSADGRELFYVAGDGYLMAVPLKPGTRGFEWSTPRPLLRMPMAGSFYEPTVRGDRFLTLTPVEGSRRNELTVLMNWQSGLK